MKTLHSLDAAANYSKKGVYFMQKSLNVEVNEVLGNLQQHLARIPLTFCCSGLTKEDAAQAADHYLTTSSCPPGPIEEHC